MEKASWKKICSLVLGAVVLYWLLNHFSVVTGAIGSLLSLFSPYILGGALAFIINVPMAAIERKLKLKKNKRAAAFGITIILFIAVITFCALVIVPQVVDTIQMIANQVPTAVSTGRSSWKKYHSQNCRKSFHNGRSTGVRSRKSWWEYYRIVPQA